MPHIREIAKECRSHYIKVWTRILRDWLGWSTARIDGWLMCFAHELDGSDEGMAVWLYHDRVMRKISPLLIRDELAAYLKCQNSDDNYPHDLMALQRRIEDQAVFTNDRVYCDAINYDWDAAKARVEETLAALGSTLPQPVDVTDYESRVRRSRT